jgi:uncharacterized protein YkwD
MRTVLSLAVVFGLIATAPAADPPKITGTQPGLVLAQAASKDGKVTLTLKCPVTKCFPKTRAVKMDVVKKVDGKDVTETVTKNVTEMDCVTEWYVTEVRLGDAGVAVTDATGKAVTSEDVLKRLEKETAVLRCVGGPADPFYLQTTKPDTLVLVTPGSPIQPVTPAPGGVFPPPPPPKAAPPAKPKGEFEPSATEQEVIDLTNAERKKAGLPALTASPKLVKAARLHCANMANQGKLAHTLDEKTADQRVTDAGYKWTRSGENIAQGQRTPEEAVTSWMNSPAHRDNILTKEYSEIGVAVAEAKDGQKYWTMVLASDR